MQRGHNSLWVFHPILLEIVCDPSPRVVGRRGMKLIHPTEVVCALGANRRERMKEEEDERRERRRNEEKRGVDRRKTRRVAGVWRQSGIHFEIASHPVRPQPPDPLPPSAFPSGKSTAIPHS